MATDHTVSTDLLQGLSPLQNLPQASLTALAAQLTVETWAKGRYLFRQGDALEHFVYLLTGTVLLLQDGQEMDTLTGGTAAARFALAHHQPRRLSAKAQTDITLLRIPLHAVPQAPSSLEQTGGREEWLTRMLQHWVFQKIPSSHVDTILARMTPISVQKGQIIIRQGEKGDYYYVIKRGRCQVTRRTSGGEREVVLAELEVGESFGEMSLLSRGERNATITMLTAGELLRLSVQDFTTLIRDPILKPVGYLRAMQLQAQGARWVDVRSEADYRSGCLPGALNLPVQSLRGQLDDLRTDQRYLIYCADGVASATVAFLMCKRGFDAYLLEGGLTSAPATALTHPTPLAPPLASPPVSPAPAPSDYRGEATERDLRQLQAQYERAQAARLAAERARQAEEQESERLRTELAEQLLGQQESRTLLAEKDRQIAQLEQQGNELRSAVEQARAEIAKAYAEAEVQMRLRQEEGKFLRLELGELQKRGEKEQRVLQETERQYAQAQLDLERLRDQHELQLQQAEQALAQASKAQAELHQTLTQTRTEASQQLVPLQQECATLRKTHAELTAQLEAATAARDQATQELELLWQGAHRAVGGDDKQRFDLIDARARLSEAAKHQAVLEQRYQAAMAEQTRLQIRLEALQSQHGAATETQAAEASDLQARLRSLEQTHGETAEALEAARHQVEYFRDQTQKIRQEFEDYKTQLQVREQALEAELSEARQQQQLAMSSALQFDGLELERMRREATEARRQSDDFQKQLNALRKAKSELEMEHRLQKQEADTARQQVQALEKKQAGHQEELDKKEHQRIKAEQDNVKLRDQLAGMVAKLQKQSGQAVQEASRPVAAGAGLALGLGTLLGMVLGAGGLWGWNYYQNQRAAEVVSLDEPTRSAPESQTPVPTIKTEQTPEPAPRSVAKVLRSFQDRLRDGGEGPKMLSLGGGSFTMGRPHPTDADQQPAHAVRLAGFALSQYETSFADYDRFARSTGRALPADNGWGRGNQPVINVSWNDAQAYTQWLSQQTGQRYRLPTEAEWEYAASGGVDAIYWWGMTPDKRLVHCFDCAGGYSGKRPLPLGQLKANPLQFYEILGNVKEWVQDCYAPNYQQASETGNAFLAPNCPERVIRGGSYNTPINNLRTARRERAAEDFRTDSLGFRVARD